MRHDTRDQPDQDSWVIAALILFFFLSALSVAFSIRTWGGGDSLWDLTVYTRAVNDYASGIDPYRTNAGLPFIYHPYVLIIFFWADRFVSLPLILIAFYLAAILYCFAELFLISQKKFPYTNKKTILALFCLLIFGSIGYGRAGVVSFLTGNLTVFIHLTLVAVLMSFIRSRAEVFEVIFVFLVGLFSIIKPYLLAYVLVAFVFIPVRRALIYGVLTVAFFSSVWISAIIFTPTEFSSFLASLRYQTIESGDLGYSVFGLARNYLSNQNSMVVHLVVMGVYTYASFFLIPKIMRIRDDKGERILILLVAVILLNPRMKEYDFFVAVVCAFFFVFLVNGQRAFIFLSAGMMISVLPVLCKILIKIGIHIPQVLLEQQFLQVAGLGTIIFMLVFHEVYRSRFGSRCIQGRAAGI